MSDLIYRQDAIDCVSEMLNGIFVEYEDIAKKAIGKLPSAQPVNYGSTNTDSSSQLKLDNDLISRQDVLNELDGCDYELKEWQRWKLKSMVRDIPSCGADMIGENND